VKYRPFVILVLADNSLGQSVCSWQGHLDNWGSVNSDVRVEVVSSGLSMSLLVIRALIGVDSWLGVQTPTTFMRSHLRNFVSFRRRSVCWLGIGRRCRVVSQSVGRGSGDSVCTGLHILTALVLLASSYRIWELARCLHRFCSR
jgi:hypothetical protein